MSTESCGKNEVEKNLFVTYVTGKKFATFSSCSFIDQEDENRTISLIPFSVADQLTVILDSLPSMWYNYPRDRVLLVYTYPYIF